MNVAQYKPSNTMRAAALESLSRFASISEAAQQAGTSETAAGDDEAATGARYMAEAAFDIGGVPCLCDFARDGSVRIVKYETDAREIAIPDRIAGHPVTTIGPHAFCTCYQLEDVSLPATVVEIGEYAFMNTALAEFSCPARLRAIGKNAFYKCSRLKRMGLNEGLERIGECAFRESALESLGVPASVAHIGHDAFRDTRLAFAGDRPTLGIAAENPFYGLLDGALYHVGEGGLTLVQLLQGDACAYAGPAGLAFVADRSFAGAKYLARASFPEGTLAIGEAAFKGCTALAHVHLPDSLRCIGKHAFANTALEELSIPAELEEIGTAALYTGGSIARSFRRSIAHVDISPGNDHFYLHDGMLCQRREKRGDIVLLYVGDAERIAIPRTITEIGPYAFLQAPSVRELHIHDGIEAIDVGGFDVGHAITAVVYDTYDGERPGERFVVRYPPGQAGYQAARQTFARGYFDLSYAFASADNAILITQDTLVRAKAMLERLAAPVMLDGRMKAEFLRKLRRTLTTTVVAFGRGGFAQGIDLLYEQGILTENTIDEAIEAASDASEIAVLSRLIELKRTAFAARMFDFDL